MLERLIEITLPPIIALAELIGIFVVTVSVLRAFWHYFVTLFKIGGKKYPIKFELANGLDALEALCGQIGTVTVSGGMSRSTLFNQIQSNVFARAISRPAHDEATAFGAWLSARVACGFDERHESAFARVMAGQIAPTAYVVTPEQQALYARQKKRALALYQSLTAAREFLS